MREEEIKVRDRGVYIMLEEERRKAMTEAKELKGACMTEGKHQSYRGAQEVSVINSGLIYTSSSCDPSQA